MQVKVGQPVVCVVVPGYIGIPLATAFSRCLSVTGFDIGKNRVKELNHHNVNQLKFHYY